jgi:hypothetical protein
VQIEGVRGLLCTRDEFPILAHKTTNNKLANSHANSTID